MKHLLSIDELDRSELEGLLDLAANFAEVQTRDIPKVPALRGKTVVLAFFEDSTRTRTSFDLAARRLSADVVNFSVSSSATTKGESLRDTVETIGAMGVDAIVVRHSSSGAPQRIAEWTDAAVVNAGDGWHQHPTQALLDSYTIQDRLGRLDGRKIAICGDIKHSRVARSNAFLLTKMGAEVRFVAPASLLPLDVEELGVTAYHRIEPALEGADVVMMLRIQLERQKKINFPSMREYYDFFALTPERLWMASEGALVMHPGPMNRGVEIDSLVADGDQSVILDQVTNGVAIRMAILYLLAGGRSEAASDS